MRTSKHTVDSVSPASLKVGGIVSCCPCSRCEIGDLLNGPVGKSGQDLVQGVADRDPEPALTSHRVFTQPLLARLLLQMSGQRAQSHSMTATKLTSSYPALPVQSSQPCYLLAATTTNSNSRLFCHRKSPSQIARCL